MPTGKHVDLELDILKLPLVEYIKVRGLQIRDFNKESDIKILTNLFNTIWKESKGPEINLTEETVKRIPADHILLAEFNKEPVGFIIFDLIEEEGEKKGVIRFIGVLKQYRGKKIASAMAFRAGEQLLRYGIQKLKAYIPEKNQTALNFIQFFGFEKKEELDYTPKFPN
ncbi:MAG TPA: GNAT family N-acetyltransferase [Candidatus Deferrimicrobium sp.]|nr:GNAT family N-acetyltransferase [Candidatus Deferrimicrobium sp.]